MVTEFGQTFVQKAECVADGTSPRNFVTSVHIVTKCRHIMQEGWLSLERNSRSGRESVDTNGKGAESITFWAALCICDVDLGHKQRAASGYISPTLAFNLALLPNFSARRLRYK